MSSRSYRGVLVATGTLIAALLLLHARPAAILGYLKATETSALLVAFGLHGALLTCRSWRLRLLSRGELPLLPSVLLFSTVQAASALLPWRLGELLLPPLAKAARNSRLAKGAFWWLGGRFFDLWSLAALAALAAALRLLPAVVLPPAFLLLTFLTLLWCTAPVRLPWRWLGRLAPSRRWVRGLWRFRYALTSFQKEKGFQRISFALSLGGWLLVAAYTGVLASGMGTELSPRQVLLAVVGAALGAAIPLAGLGNLGPLEAGFASALSLGGIPMQEALALGFALHFWTLLFQLLLGAAAFFALFRLSPPPQGKLSSSFRQK